jgi:uncharacterized protein
MTVSLLVLAAAAGTFGATSSVHCAAMCGPLVSAVVPPRAPSLARYLGARLVAYTTLSSAAGLLGQSFEHSVPTLLVPGLGLVAALFLALHGFGVSFDLGRLSIGRFLGRLLRTRADSRSPLACFVRSPNGRSVLLGAATALLPCGLLASVYALAAATGRPLAGAVVGASFAVGSGLGLLALPALLRALRAAPSRRGADAAHLVERGLALVAAVALGFRAIVEARGGSCHLP